MNARRTVFLSATIGLLMLVASACTGGSSLRTPTSLPTSTQAQLGSISGRSLYASNDPSLRVYAREVNTGHVQWVSADEVTVTYTIPGLAPGTYVVVGWFYALGASGAYTSLDTVVAEGEDQMHDCEAAILEIDLQPGEAYTGADIGCWGGDFFGLTE